MKNTVLNALVAIIIIIVMPGICDHVETHYIKTDCTIVEIADNYAVAEEKDGTQWSWYIDNADLQIGDKVDLKMYNSHTDYDWTDDEVVSVN